MPTPNNILVLVVVATAMVLFVTEKLRVDVTALCILTLLLLLQLISPGQALYGFASPATATVAAMFVLSAGLVRTGLVQWLARNIDRAAGKSELQLMVILCVVIGALSAFIVNTATVAIFIPVAISLARSRNISPSRVLLPLSFASQFGGVCTLIGTSTNILVNAIVLTRGMKPFGLFEFSPLGLAMSFAGILYLVIVGRRMLPRREGEIQQVDKYRLSDYFAELQVREKSSFVDKTWQEIKKDVDGEIHLIKLVRDDKAMWRPSQVRIREGDVLLVHGDVDKLISMKDEHGLDIQADLTMEDRKLSSDEVKLIEALVPPRSRLVGRTLRMVDFYRRYGSIVLGIQRRGKVLRDRLVDVRLDGGDTLLLQGDREDVSHLMRSSDMIVTNELTDLYLRKDRAIIALCLLILVVALAAFNIVPILIAALIGAVGMVLSGCLTIEEAYQAIDWKVVFLLGGILPLGLALEQTGTADWLVKVVLAPFSDYGPLVLLGGLYLMTAVLTETMSNNAAAILLAPIALSMAASLEVNPRPFLIAITFAASTSFATPVGYQTNTMVYAPGGYRFIDFTRIGGPLNLIFLGVALLLIPRIWPF
jgi:di/tricarboxylate transporter